MGRVHGASGAVASIGILEFFFYSKVLENLTINFFLGEVMRCHEVVRVYMKDTFKLYHT